MLELKKITKSFTGVFAPVLDGINLKINQGDFCVIIGPNGCGKSTLLKVISGEYKADSGKINIKENISQVTQDVNIGTIGEMTLLENITLSQKSSAIQKFSFYKNYKDQVIEKIQELGIGLEKYIKEPLSSLSGGQRQMLATLMAINFGGKILLLDEHTSALDPKMQNILMDYTVKSILKHNLTSLMITHKMDDAIKYGNRLIMLHSGKIVTDISGAEKERLTTKDLLALFHQLEGSL